jgi:hypothetical protein
MRPYFQSAKLPCMFRFRTAVNQLFGTAVVLAVIGATISGCGHGRDSAAVTICAALADGDVVAAPQATSRITTTDLDLDVPDLQYMLGGAAMSLATQRAGAQAGHVQGDDWVPQS